MNVLVKMKDIKTSKIKKITRDLLIKASFNLPGDVIEAIKQARDMEDNQVAVDMLDMILKNAEIAAKKKMPLCQDCGSVYIDIDVGPDVCIEPGDKADYQTFYDALNDAVLEVYESYYLRKSIVYDPLFERENTKTNTPAIINIAYTNDPGLGIEVNIKGGGSENCSWLFMLNPSAEQDEIMDRVLDLVRENVTRACPPVIIGIGLGATASEVTKLARKATFRDLNVRNSSPKYGELESAILRQVNKTGIGPQGMGGKTTSLAVNIEFAPCHMATLPLAVFFGCHSTRRAGITIA
jgi:fumarate hydratase subunit alpha